MIFNYRPFAAATDGMLSGRPFCSATDGFLCPLPRVVVSPAPAEAEALDRRRYDRDMRDIGDILDILGYFAT